MKKLLIIVVAILVVIVGAIQGLAWWNLKSDLDSSLETARVKAEVTYDGLGGAFGDAVTLEGALIKPAGTEHEIYIEELTVTPKQPDDIEPMLSLLGKDVYPTEVEVSFTGLTISLDKPLPRAFRKTPVEKISLGNILAYGCGKTAAIDAVELKKMGYKNLRFNGGFRYLFDPLTGDISGRFDLDAPDMARASGRFKTNLPSINSLGVVTGLLNNKFESFEVNLADQGFQKRYVDFCTAETKLKKETFLKAHIARMKTIFGRFGIGFNQGVWTALESYQNTGGTLEFSFAVPEDTDFSKMKSMKQEALGELLSLSVSQNDKAVEKPGFSFDLMQYADAIYSNSFEGSEWRNYVPAPPEKKVVSKKKHIPQFTVVSFSRLSKYLKHDIRITTNNGGTKEGVLKEVRGKEIYISRQVGNGEGVFKVYSYDAKKIEVLF